MHRKGHINDAPCLLLVLWNPDKPVLNVSNGRCREMENEEMVGAGGIEPPTPTVSRWCSPTELRANNDRSGISRKPSGG
jgi:hypothetical protein